MKSRIFIFLALITALSACSETSKTNMLIGTWSTSLYVSSEEAAKMSEEAFPPGMSMELTMNGTGTYHQGGKSNAVAEYTIRIKANDQELPLRFMVRQAGTWELHGDTLVETSIDSVVIPLDNLTRNVVSKSPEFQAMITPVKGEAVSIKIEHISKTLVEMRLLTPPYFRLTMHKKTGNGSYSNLVGIWKATSVDMSFAEGRIPPEKMNEARQAMLEESAPAFDINLDGTARVFGGGIKCNGGWSVKNNIVNIKCPDNFIKLELSGGRLTTLPDRTFTFERQ